VAQAQIMEKLRHDPHGGHGGHHDEQGRR